MKDRKKEELEAESLAAYSRAIDQAWNFYDREIAYRPANTQTELITLTGHYEGKLAIKIPDSLDDRSGTYIRRLENFFNIEIRKFVFRSEYSMPHAITGRREHRLYNIYLYRNTQIASV